MRPQKLLYPFALIYGVVTVIRRWLYRIGLLEAYQAPISTIGVGNLSVGGTGKTPHVEYLISLLSERYKIATLSRGYKRKTKGFVLANVIDPQKLSAEMIGDEPLQFFTKFPHIKVAVAEKRKEGLVRLQHRFPDLQCIILDDCYQHLQVNPHLSILITEYQNPYAKDYPLPAGCLREFPSAARYADIVIVSKCPLGMTKNQAEEMKRLLNLQVSQQLFFTILQYADLQAVNECAKKQYLTILGEGGKKQQEMAQTEVVLLTAIAHPEPMVAHLSQKFRIIHHYRFSDHHFFSAEEIKKIKSDFFEDKSKDRVLITTEKDSMRLMHNDILKILEDIPLFVQPIEPYFLFQEGERFDGNILKLFDTTSTVK